MSPSPRLANITILVAEDTASLQALYCRILQRLGATVISASSGRQALDLLESARPDVLVSDIAMADGDGLSLIRDIRRRESDTGEYLPAAAISAFGERFRENALSEGFDCFASKPVAVDKLGKLVDELVSRGRSEALKRQGHGVEPRSRAPT